MVTTRTKKKENGTQYVDKYFKAGAVLQTNRKFNSSRKKYSKILVTPKQTDSKVSNRNL